MRIQRLALPRYSLRVHRRRARVDGVLGGLPVRQWVLTLPYRLRYALAWDHRLCRSVLGVFIRAVLAFERRRAEQRGILGGAGGPVTAIQRFGSALNVNVHFHTLVAQGVFIEDTEGKRRFVPSPPPTDRDVGRLLTSVRRRIVRLVARHGIDLEDPSGEAQATDERLFDCPLYAEIQGAAVVGRVATGPRAGGAVQRLGRDRYAAEIASTGPLHAHLDGFDLHAAVAVPAGDRKRLEHLCRYVLRPPIAQERLELAPDGAVLLRLRRPWSDGTRAIRFEPNEFLEKLAAMIPKPRINLLVYHGVFAPHAHGRQDAVRRAHEGAARAAAPPATGETASDLASAAPAAAPTPQPVVGVPATPRPPPPRAGYVRPKYFAWAALLERTFSIDVLACPECGGRLRLIATINDHDVIKKILGHLGLPTEAPTLMPAKVAGWLPGVETPADWITE